MHTRKCTSTHTNHTLFHARTRAHTTRGRLLAKPAARAPALLTPQPKCARARLKGRHTPAGAGSAILQGPYLLPARMHRPHPPITGAAECPLPAPAFDHGDQQPIPGTGTCSLTRDLGQPGFQWLPQVPGRPGPRCIGQLWESGLGWEESKHIPSDPTS